MPKERIKQKLMKHRICSVARIIACASFLMLTIIGVSSLVRAMSLESIEHQNGIPSSWKIASLGNPDTITVPISYWDQRQDSCEDQNRQFEWTMCDYWTTGALQGVVRDTLGADGLPVPTYTNSTEAWAANRDVFTANVTGHNPVQPSDNFYRWFHETSVSKQYDREITFKRIGNNSYTYGGQNIYPLDNIDFSKDDPASQSAQHSEDRMRHNFHFTAHLSVPIKVAADGTEIFEFSGDDDVWVFLNGKLVLDIGGLHEALQGNFKINTDGTITSFVQKVNDVSGRAKLGNPGSYNYVNNLSNHNRATYKDQTKTFDIGLEAGDIVNLDFFYAERSTTAANTRITISNMQWPISAGSEVSGTIQGKVDNTEKNLIEYVTSVSNRDPRFSLRLDRIASYIYDESSATNADGQTETFTNSGFIPLSETTLYYSDTLENPDWQPVAISAPLNSLDGFLLQEPIIMNPSGQAGDTLYFRFFAETSEYTGNITNRTSFYTDLNGDAGVTYDHDTLAYTGKTTTGDVKPVEPPVQQYQLSITYRVEADESDTEVPNAPAPITETHDNGYAYSIESPEIPGYEPNFKIVEGVIDGSDVEREVVYHKKPEEKPAQHTVTIHYVKTDGSPAFPDHVELVEAGSNVSIPSQPLEKHTHEPEIIEIENIQGDEERTVIYTPIREEHTVTIHYVYENGAQAQDDYVGTYLEGEKFSVTSPVIEGYYRDIAVVSGTMADSDREFTVTYTMIDDPVGPDPIIPDEPDPDPEVPDEPEPDPETPGRPTPSRPSEDDVLIPSLPVTPNEDDELTYTGPLGEVAYVPNTGIVSDFLSPVFDQYFADIILSQGFVLTVLLIFAGSFSTYFSLRKYLHLAVSPAANRTVKKMPKTIANSRTAKTMQKNAKKTSRTASKKKK